MSRRNLLDGIVALAALPVLAVAALVSSPDTDVIRLAQGVIEAETACHAADDIATLTPEEEAAMAPAQDRLMHGTSEKAEALAVLPVATLAGTLAKARATLAVAGKDPADSEVVLKDYEDWLAYAALEGLVRVLGAVA